MQLDTYPRRGLSENSFIVIGDKIEFTTVRKQPLFTRNGQRKGTQTTRNKFLFHVHSIERRERKFQDTLHGLILFSIEPDDVYRAGCDASIPVKYLHNAESLNRVIFPRDDEEARDAAIASRDPATVY